MPATTIKLEGELVEKVTRLKPAGQSISAYVRDLIEREHRARELRAAVTAYQRCLDEDPAERVAMEAWESARLVDQVESDKR